jgi:hypothetical protein
MTERNRSIWQLEGQLITLAGQWDTGCIFIHFNSQKINIACSFKPSLVTLNIVAILEMICLSLNKRDMFPQINSFE